MLSGLIFHLHRYNVTLVIWKKPGVREGWGGFFFFFFFFFLERSHCKNHECSLELSSCSSSDVLILHLFSDSPGLLQSKDTEGLQQPCTEKKKKCFSVKRGEQEHNGHTRQGHGTKLQSCWRSSVSRWDRDVWGLTTFSPYAYSVYNKCKSRL